MFPGKHHYFGILLYTNLFVCLCHRIKTVNLNTRENQKLNDWTMPHSSQMILFVSSVRSSSSHPNNIIYEGIPATQHFSSPHGTKKGDNLPPLENYMDNTWGPLGGTWRPLRDGWLHQNGWIFGRVPNGFWPLPSLFILKKSCCKFVQISCSKRTF